eukprot:748372-Hanusia_phi.AAC.2
MEEACDRRAGVWVRSLKRVLDELEMRREQQKETMSHVVEMRNYKRIKWFFSCMKTSTSESSSTRKKFEIVFLRHLRRLVSEVELSWKDDLVLSLLQALLSWIDKFLVQTNMLMRIKHFLRTRRETLLSKMVKHWGPEGIVGRKKTLRSRFHERGGGGDAGEACVDDECKDGDDNGDDDDDDDDCDNDDDDGDNDDDDDDNDDDDGDNDDDDNDDDDGDNDDGDGDNDDGDHHHRHHGAGDDRVDEEDESRRRSQRQTDHDVDGNYDAAAKAKDCKEDLQASFSLDLRRPGGTSNFR